MAQPSRPARTPRESVPLSQRDRASRPAAALPIFGQHALTLEGGVSLRDRYRLEQ
jgi:hypothetical protein